MHAVLHGTIRQNMAQYSTIRQWEYYTKETKHHKYMVILPTYISHVKIEGNNTHSTMSSYFTPHIHFMRAEILNIMLYPLCK